MASLNHGFAGCHAPFIVFGVASTAIGPGVRAFEHLTFSHWLELRCAFGTSLDFDFPFRPKFSQPVVQGVVVILQAVHNEAFGRLAEQHLIGNRI